MNSQAQVHDSQNGNASTRQRHALLVAPTPTPPPSPQPYELETKAPAKKHSDHSLVGDQVAVDTVVLQAALCAVLQEVVARERGEAPLVAGDDLLAAGELELGAAHGLVGLHVR